MANILIVGAMPEEVEKIQEWLKGEELNQFSRAGFPLWRAKVQKHMVYLIQSGIGKVAAALRVSRILDHFPVDYILNAGSAGGLQQAQNIGDIVLASEVSYHDVDVTASGYAWGQIPHMPARFSCDKQLLERACSCACELNLPFHKGLILSGDSFIHKATQLELLNSHFPEAIAIEMEAAAIAQVAYMYNTAYLVIRAISDKANSHSPADFASFLKKASLRSSQLIQKVLHSL